MKLRTVIFCLLLSVNALAQGIDTSVKAKSLDSVVNKDASYVIDGEVSRNKLNNVDPKNILNITIIKNVAKDPSLANGISSEVIVVTKQGAIKSYQKKFSAFSKEYKAYFDSPQNNDSDFLYVVNGIPAAVKTNEGIKRLFDIQVKKIKQVNFKDKGSILNNIKPIVVITTKQ